MEILPISEMDAMYGDANTGYIKMRASMKDGKYEYRIINACMPVTSGEEVKAIVDDFISRTTNRSKISENRSKINEKPKSLRKRPSIFTDEQKADIIRRYKAGEGPKAISESLGCSRSLITHIIRDAGAVEGRTGAHLNRKTDEPKEEPV